MVIYRRSIFAEIHVTMNHFSFVAVIIITALVSLISHLFQRYLIVDAAVSSCLESPRPRQVKEKLRESEFDSGDMLKSYPTRYSTSGAGAGTRVIRLTMDQEAVLQEQFNRWPRAPYTADIVLLAAETGLSEADVEGWYSIRLAQWRKEQGLGGNLGLH